jgi:serine/threonine protein kinase
VLALFVQAGRGLEAAHAAGLVHGNFRPSEVFVGKDGVTRVADIGIASVVESRKTLPADDQYQFCRVLSEGLEGPSAADVPIRVRRAIQRGLMESPQDRFASMTELLLELDTDPKRLWRVGVAMGLVLLGMALMFALDRCRMLE